MPKKKPMEPITIKPNETMKLNRKNAILRKKHDKR